MRLRADILIANWNTLPWLRILISRINFFLPYAEHSIYVWDCGSTDGSQNWMSQNQIAYWASKERMGHSQCLSNLIDVTNSPYMVFMDVDALPVANGWLDEALFLVDQDKVGAVGLRAGANHGYHKIFVHPSFCVVKRSLYNKLGLSLNIVHDYEKRTAFDVGESLCLRLEAEGYKLEFVGEGAFNPEGCMRNKVVHFGMSTMGLSEGASDEGWKNLVKDVVVGHRKLLGHFGLWSEFRSYLEECKELNKCCSRYLSDEAHA